MQNEVSCRAVGEIFDYADGEGCGGYCGVGDFWWLVFRRRGGGGTYADGSGVQRTWFGLVMVSSGC